MNLIFKITILFIFISPLIFCQSSEKRSLWYPADYFSGENAIESQEIFATEDELIIIYKDFNCDTIIAKKSIGKGSTLSVTNSYIEFIPGTAIMLKDTVIICNGDDFNNRIKLNIGDTLNYYIYLGEGYHLIGKGECTTELEDHLAHIMDIISDNKIISHSLYIKNLNGWIRLENNHNLELKTKWVTTY